MSLGALKFGFLVLALALTGCNSAKNLAANFIPTGKPGVELQDIKSGTYQLDPEHSYLSFSFVHMGFSKTRARFDKVEATLKFDNENPGQTSLIVTLDPASINTNVAEFDELLKSKDFFDVENFPTASFTSSEVYFTSATSAEIPGTLTVHGVSAPAVFYVTLFGAGKNWVSGKYTLGFSGTATVNRSAFGLKNLLALTGDSVTIEFDAEFRVRTD
ncbi:MAG: YceI family protein [Sphingomonadales bacterium]